VPVGGITCTFSSYEHVILENDCTAQGISIVRVRGRVRERVRVRVRVISVCVCVISTLKIMSSR